MHATITTLPVLLSFRSSPSPARLGAFIGQMAAGPGLALKSKAKARKVESCERCGGWGEIPAFRHVEGGVCFRCGGRG